jgi:glycosyltransferase involved in cell wall biosynthesis
MRILFDNQCFYLHGKGGISNYIAHLIFNLNKLDGVEVVFQGHPVYDFFIESKEVNSKNIRGLNRLKLERDKKRNLKFVKNNIDKVDYYFPTFYHPDYIPFIDQSNSAIIIHDMIHEKFPEISANSKKYSEWKRAFIKKGKLFFTVSNETLKDLKEIYTETNILGHVIYPGKSFGEIKVEKPNKGQYYLFVGNRGGYKNFEILHDRELLASIEKLVLVGGGPLSDEEKNALKSIEVEHHNPNEKELVGLYNSANALLSTSIYEGFGLPLVEAMECKTPIIVYDTPVAREVTLNEANYFSSNTELLALLVHKDLKMFQGEIPYSWEESSKRIFSILKE